ncbi:MAG TPA: hypothetical protein VFN28_05745 [Amaricoccus sp.]|nr:hypothetical protein [Amaricoccus sp.]
MNQALPTLLLAVAVLGLLPETALAYVGPGAGLTAIGTLLAFLGAIGLALVGFVWYPVKRLIRRPAGRGPEDEARR